MGGGEGPRANKTNGMNYNENYYVNSAATICKLGCFEKKIKKVERYW